MKCMKLKKGLIATAIVLALAIPATAFAATSDSTTAVKIRGLFGIDSSKLTSEQGSRSAGLCTKNGGFAN